MKCKYCGTELSESLMICPCCGGNLEDDIAMEETTEYIAEAPESVAPIKKRKVWQIALAVGCCMVLVVSVILIVCCAMGLLKPKDADFEDEDVETSIATDGDNENTDDVNDNPVYDEEAASAGNTVVAKIGGMELTNGELQVFYTRQVYEYFQYYGSYLSYIGLDPTKPLAEQTCTLDNSITWQQYFVDIAIQTWQRYAILNLLANDESIELPEYEIEKLNAIPAETETMAKLYNYASADEFLKATYGGNVDMDAYVNYMEIVYLSNYFYSYKGLKLMPLSAEIEAYFDEHKDEFAISGITKESGPIVDVRHLLVQPEGGEKDESNNTVYTDAAWESALQEAERLLNEWKNGAATQDSFAALASEHTDDGGSKENGGLYQNITRTSNYVKPFLEWSVDESRKPGDTDIVKTKFGYHIMYFVNGQPQWFMAAQTQLLSERMNEIIDAGAEKWPMEVNKEEIAICTNEIVK